MESFIDVERLESTLHTVSPDPMRVREIIDKSLHKQRLSLEETALLLSIRNEELKQELFQGARRLKEEIYGKRVVLFAPLYVGNLCTNDCRYCGFRVSNRGAKRQTLTTRQIDNEVRALERKGHKRLILVFGEHPKYTADYIAEVTRQVYAIKEGHGEIRRVNINAAPLDVPGYRRVKETGIGTYQVFQETYHPDTYMRYHPTGQKADFLWRLYALDRAQEAGVDDVGIGALFGLYNWRYEVMGLLSHVEHLEERFGVGPHTISFPRFQPAHGVELPDNRWLVNNDDFRHLVAVLRLAVPYTGLILTAREEAAVRDDVIDLGCSQIDAGSRIELGSYSEDEHAQELSREQFSLGDTRSVDEMMRQLLDRDYTPSFCTSCYRMGRTGEEFMEFAIPGFIRKFCTPNALVTLKEYLVDYASPETRRAGDAAIARTLERMENESLKREVEKRLLRIEAGERDLYF